MPDIQKISIALTGKQIAAMKTVVKAGEYATTSEVVREALREWQFRREIRDEDIKRLKQQWKEGKSSGKIERPDFKVLKKAANKKLAQARKTSANAR